jgi:solute:Na+ symporter, SSS family
MTIMLVIVIGYTVLEGMFLVVVTDFMQFVILSLGMLVSTVAVLMKVDVTQISDSVTWQFGASGVNPLINPRYGWIFIIWILMSNLAAAALWQPGTSKALASESPEVARKVLFYTSLAFAGLAMIPMFWGVAAGLYWPQAHRGGAYARRSASSSLPVSSL